MSQPSTESAWRLLGPGELVQEGDQLWSKVEGEWVNSNNWCSPMRMQAPQEMYRRRADASESGVGQTGPLLDAVREFFDRIGYKQWKCGTTYCAVLPTADFRELYEAYQACEPVEYYTPKSITESVRAEFRNESGGWVQGDLAAIGVDMEQPYYDADRCEWFEQCRVRI